MSDSDLRNIWDRSKVACPDMTFHDIDGLNQLYDYAVIDLAMVPIEAGRKWFETFNYMVEISGLPKMKVSCYIVARREFLAGTFYKDSVMDKLSAGAEAILNAPGEAINEILAPITGPESPVTKTFTALAWTAGGLGSLWVLSQFLKGRGVRA
jgi:hypothetical protein